MYIDLPSILGDWVTFVNWCMLSIVILILLGWLYESLDDLWINFCEGCKKWWKGELRDGIKFGRKDVIDEDKEYEIYRLRNQGKSYRKIADVVGISHTRVAQQCKSMSLA
tara:strand:- start:7 stop:336 length:330 start_codon:yes stop_codon:yes gene_type:complete